MVKLAKYAVVGAISCAIDFCLTFALLSFTSLLIANTIGFAVANAANFILGRAMVFERPPDGRSVAGEYWRVLAISLVGLAINDFVVLFCVHAVELGVLASKVIAAALVFVWNYAARTQFVYRRPR
jgi:putative flippase GtrA